MNFTKNLTLCILPLINAETESYLSKSGVNVKMYEENGTEATVSNSLPMAIDGILGGDSSTYVRSKVKYSIGQKAWI